MVIVVLSIGLLMLLYYWAYLWSGFSIFDLPPTRDTGVLWLPAIALFFAALLWAIAPPMQNQRVVKPHVWDREGEFFIFSDAIHDTRSLTLPVPSAEIAKAARRITQEDKWTSDQLEGSRVVFLLNNVEGGKRSKVDRDALEDFWRKLIEGAKGELVLFQSYIPPRLFARLEDVK